MLKAIIFDMDGVLVDSTLAVWTSFNTLLKEEDINFPGFSDEYIKKNLARSLRDNLLAWKKEFGLRDYDVMECSKKVVAIQLEMLKDQRPDKDMLKFLKAAKDNDILCAVATSSKGWRAEKILEMLNIRTFFDVVVTADDVTMHKPAPDVFLRAAKLLDVKPEECVVIEDAKNGIDAARVANMKTIGKITKYNSIDELEHADLTIKDFSELQIEKVRELF